MQSRGTSARAILKSWNICKPCRYASVAASHFDGRPTRNHKVVVIGCGSAGVTVSHQLLRSGRFKQDDICIVDPAAWHHYQPGWTLVGAGLKNKRDLRRPLTSLIDPQLKYYREAVSAFTPQDNFITLADGSKIGYEQLVVTPGIMLYPNTITGLPEALADPESPVTSIYSYDTCDKVYPKIQALRSGRCIFTQPAGIVKCAGAPQKIMWLALDYWKRAGLYNAHNSAQSPIHISFATALAQMFGVAKYSERLDKLRVERGVEALFQHDLVSIDGDRATFVNIATQEKVDRTFDFLHVVPKMGPHQFIRDSPLANEAGFVDVDDFTTQHKKFSNVWSIGDASSLPTSKTAAAITSQSPVLVSNVLNVMDGKPLSADYTGYTSCPLLTEYGKVLLAEFEYGGKPKETFGRLLDQGVPRRAFYYLKKDFFPWVYYKSMVKGTWAGPKGWLK